MTKVYNLLKHPLFAGSMIMLFGSNIFNVTQFIYHFVAGRMLGKVLYGDFASLISIFGIMGIIQVSLGLTIIKFIASEKHEKNVANFSRWFNWWGILAGILIALATVVFAPTISSFLKIKDLNAVFVLAFTVFFFIVLNVQRSILQGLLKFDKYILSLFAEAIVKISLTIILVLFGLSVFGTMVALFLAVLLSLFSTRISLRSYLGGRRLARPKVGPLVKYSLPVFAQGLAFTSMYSTDLFLVKHFFSPAEAGIYASIAILGRVALFSSSPVTQAMFPIVAGRHSRGEPYKKIFYLSFIATLVISLPVVLLYKLSPGIPINVLYGPQFIEGAPLLWFFGLFMTLLSICMLFSQFYLSIGKTKIVWLFVISALLQAILIWVNHPDLATVIKMSIICASLLLTSFVAYLPYSKR